MTLHRGEGRSSELGGSAGGVAHRLCMCMSSDHFGGVTGPSTSFAYATKKGGCLVALEV